MWEDSRHSMISYPQGKYILVWFVISFGKLKELYDRPVDIEPVQGRVLSCDLSDDMW